MSKLRESALSSSLGDGSFSMSETKDNVRTRVVCLEDGITQTGPQIRGKKKQVGSNPGKDFSFRGIICFHAANDQFCDKLSGKNEQIKKRKHLSRLPH